MVIVVRTSNLPNAGRDPKVGRTTLMISCVLFSEITPFAGVVGSFQNCAKLLQVIKKHKRLIRMHLIEMFKILIHLLSTQSLPGSIKL